ncbi:MAG: hypothetical protein HPY52_15705 [Firmicutes bacterium]|nr:hypothetical protein [Bacillota bacterium]
MTHEGSSQYVPDSHAILAWLQGETGGEVVTSLLERARHGEVKLSMSVINLGEILYIIE